MSSLSKNRLWALWHMMPPDNIKNFHLGVLSVSSTQAIGEIGLGVRRRSGDTSEGNFTRPSCGQGPQPSFS